MRKSIMTITLVAALIAPAGAVAGWGAKGDFEPSTSYDKNDGYMHQTASTSGSLVYFNGFSGVCFGAYVACVSSTFNPNVATLESSMANYPTQVFAMLGYWLDCNNDGFVGMGDQGLLEYAAALNEHDPAICAAESYPVNDKNQAEIPRGWKPMHNDGQLIREWIPIGWDSQPGTKGCKPATAPSACSDTNAFDLHDPDARVWADWGEPGAPPGRQCYVRPQPTGTFQSVGGMTTYADCFLNNRLAAAVGTAGLGAQYALVNGVKNPWGVTGDGSYADAFDCKKDDQAAQVNPAANVWVNVSNPRATPTTNTGGSMAGTLNETTADFDDCRENNENDNSAARAPYSTEQDLKNLNGPRDQHDQVLAYNEGVRTPAPVDVYRRTGLGPAVPDDLGVGATRTTDFWSGTSITGVSRNPYFDRDAIQPMAVSYMTFYAYVGADAAVKHGLTVPGGLGKYGAEACATPIGVQNSWHCDPAAWWTPDAEGKKTMPEARILGQLTDIGVKVGQDYNLRDVDCWDNSIGALRSEGLTWGALTGTACKL